MHALDEEEVPTLVETPEEGQEEFCEFVEIETQVSPNLEPDSLLEMCKMTPERKSGGC